MSNQGNDASSTLRRVAEQLLTLANTGMPTTTPSAVSTTEPSVEEHRRLFNYSAGRRPMSFQPTSSMPRASSKRKAKARKITTCTIKFFCLSKVYAKCPPTQIAEKAALANNELGPGTIVFDADGNSGHFHEKVMEKFPGLEEGGGYELLLYQRGGVEKGFHKIEPPFTPGRVKEVASQAQVYIRPLQQDLKLKAPEVDTSSHDEIGPIIECFDCKEMVPMFYIKEHQQLAHQANKRKLQQTSVESVEEEQDTCSDIKKACHKFEIDECQVHDETPSLAEDDSTVQCLRCSLNINIVDLDRHHASCVQRASSQISSPEETNIATLKDIFPEIQEDELTSALTAEGNVIENAIDSIMSQQEKENYTEEREMAFQSPLPEAPLGSAFANEDPLEAFREANIIMAPTQPITFNRSKKPFVEVCRIYKNPRLKLQRELVAYFSSEMDDGEYEEEAADVGGPKKEFCNIVTEATLTCTSPQLFEGDSDHKLPVHNQQLLLQEMFCVVGKAWGHCYLQARQQIPGLAAPVKVFLATGCPESACEAATINDVADLEVKESITLINNASEENLADLNVHPKILDLMVQSGVSVATLTPATKAQVVYECIVYNVVYKRIKELEQLQSGFNSVCLSDFLRSNCRYIKEVFPTQEHYELNPQVVVNVIKPFVSRELNSEESKVLNFFKQYVAATREPTAGVTLKDLIQFLTGGSSCPRKISVKFTDKKSLPDPDTCFDSVTLSTLTEDFNEFCKELDCVVSMQSKGYGRS